MGLLDQLWERVVLMRLLSRDSESLDEICKKLEPKIRAYAEERNTSEKRKQMIRAGLIKQFGPFYEKYVDAYHEIEERIHPFGDDEIKIKGHDEYFSYWDPLSLLLKVKNTFGKKFGAQFAVDLLGLSQDIDEDWTLSRYYGVSGLAACRATVRSNRKKELPKIVFKKTVYRTPEHIKAVNTEDYFRILHRMLRGHFSLGYLEQANQFLDNPNQLEFFLEHEHDGFSYWNPENGNRKIN